MLRQYGKMLRSSMIFVDMFIAAISFVAAFFINCALHPDHFFPLFRFYWLIPFLATTWAVALYKFGMYKSFRLKSWFQIVLNILAAAGTVFIVFSSGAFIFKFDYLSRLLIVLTLSITTGLLIAEKIAVSWWLHHIRRQGFNSRNILVVGTSTRARDFIDRIKYHPEYGLKIVGIIDFDDSKLGTFIQDVPVMGTLTDLQDILWSHPIDNVYFIVPRSLLNTIDAQLQCCETLGISFSVAMDLFDMQFAMARAEDVADMPMATFDCISQKHGQLIFKRIIDIAVSGVLLLILAPVFAIIAFLIKYTDQGQVFFAQERCSLNGRRFKMYKFRTMVSNAEQILKDLEKFNQMEGPAFKMENDPRITVVGKFLRKFSLDELPQLWNVFRGEMSLVGPRPPLPREVANYGLWHRRRLSMRPGITCLWQVSGRNRISNFDEWTKLDLKYIDEWSLALDFNILLRTVPAVLSTSGAK